MSTNCKRGGTSRRISSARARERIGVVDDGDLRVRGVRGGGWKGEAVRLGV